MRSRQWFLSRTLRQTPDAAVVSQETFDWFVRWCEIFGQLVAGCVPGATDDTCCDILLVHESPSGGLFGSRAYRTAEGGIMVTIPITRIAVLQTIARLIHQTPSRSRPSSPATMDEHAEHFREEGHKFHRRHFSYDVYRAAYEDELELWRDVPAVADFRAEDWAVVRQTAHDHIYSQIITGMSEPSAETVQSRATDDPVASAVHAAIEAHCQVRALETILDLKRQGTLSRENAAKIKVVQVPQNHDAPARFDLDVAIWTRVPESERMSALRMIACRHEVASSVSPPDGAPDVMARFAFFFTVLHELAHAFDGHFLKPPSSVSHEQFYLELLADERALKILISAFASEIDVQGNWIGDDNLREIYCAVALTVGLLHTGEFRRLGHKGYVDDAHPAACVRWHFLRQQFVSRTDEPSLQQRWCDALAATGHLIGWGGPAALGSLLFEFSAPDVDPSRVSGMLTSISERLPRLRQALRRRLAASVLLEQGRIYDPAIRLTDILVSCENVRSRLSSLASEGALPGGNANSEINLFSKDLAAKLAARQGDSTSDDLLATEIQTPLIALLCRIATAATSPSHP